MWQQQEVAKRDLVNKIIIKRDRNRNIAPITRKRSAGLPFASVSKKNKSNDKEMMKKKKAIIIIRKETKI